MKSRMCRFDVARSSPPRYTNCERLASQMIREVQAFSLSVPVPSLVYSKASHPEPVDVEERAPLLAPA